MTPNPVACSVQMVRSMAMWSGANRKETSLCHAHFALINKAKHFIYIENQVRRSSCACPRVACYVLCG
jgi:hypothetical protein